MLDYEFITQESDLPRVATDVAKAAVLGVDIETTHLDPRYGEIRLLQLVVPSDANNGRGRIYVIDLFETKGPGPILAALQDTKAIFIVHNAKFEQKWLWWKWRFRMWPIFCTFRASALIYNGKKGLKHDLDTVVIREMGEHPVNVGQGKTDWSGRLTQAQKDYAAEDVLRLISLRVLLKKKLAEYGLLKAALIEFGVVFAEGRVELNGFPIDAAKWRALAHENIEKRRQMKEELLCALPHPAGQMSLPGMSPGWNVDSPKQMLASLRLLGLDVDGTQEIVLAQYAKRYKPVQMLLEYRHVAQLVKTYGLKFLRHVDSDGRIHPDYYGMLVTGRYSANKSMQQIPRPAAFRGCFRPKPGRRFAGADYCLVPETRVLRSDLRWVEVGKLEEGDELIAFDEHLDGRKTRLRPSVVEKVKRIRRPCFRVVTTRGTVVASDEHGWVCKKRSSRVSRTREWVKTNELEPGDEIAFLCEPWEEDTTREGGYLAGIFDGEGHLGSGRDNGRRNTVAVSQKPGAVWDATKAGLRRRGFEFNEYPKGNDVRTLEMGVLDGGLRLLGSIRPTRLLEQSRSLWDGRSTWGRRTRPARVLRVERVYDREGGHTREVVAVQTSTRTLVAEGFLTHNSGIEMRLCAEISGDVVLTQVFLDGLDAHRATAAVIMELHPDAVTSGQRQSAKPVNFGLIYGMMPDKLVLYAMANYGVALSLSQARQYRKRYFSRYQGIEHWHRRVLRDGQRLKMSRTLSGRLRYLDPNEAFNEFYNCLDEETEALTERGWVRGFDLRDDDVLLTKNAETGQLEWQETTEVKKWPDYEGPLVEFKSRSFSAVSTPNHRWLVRNKGTGRDEVKTTEELSVWGDHRIHRTGYYPGREEHLTTSDGLVELSGWFLTDGTYVEKDRATMAPRPTARIYQSQRANPDKVRRIDALMDRLARTGVKARRYFYERDQRVTWELDEGWSKTLHTVFPERRLTPGFLRGLTRDQLHLLRDTMIAGDGTIEASGKVSFCAGSEKAAGMFQILCTLCGHATTLHERDMSAYRPKSDLLENEPKMGTVYYVNLLRRDKVQVVGRQRREFQAKQGVWCPIVPNTFFVARRKGHVYITGNTPVQGSGADALKTSLAIVQDRIDNMFGITPAETPDGPVQIVHHVHDEILTEADDDHEMIRAVEIELSEGMKEGMEKFVKRVPVVVDPANGYSWADVH